MKTFKELREKFVDIRKKVKGVSVVIKSGKKGLELHIDGDLVADDFKSKKDAEDTAKEVLKSLGK